MPAMSVEQWRRIEMGELIDAYYNRAAQGEKLHFIVESQASEQ